MTVNVLYIVGAAVCLGLIFEMVRRRTLREKYALLWLLIGLLVLVVGVAPQVLEAVSDALGVAVPANLLFFVASVTLLLVSVQQSSELGRLEERTRTLAEECAQLRLLVETGRHESSEAGAEDQTVVQRGEGLTPGSEA
ncbi:DUF2304 domain-containing protein [uncultured Pseudokineococcus sp.]|uniref:DUF2304 domain-containing protein n=1 Tax=uncultured Pseudokineococcus sp. TaxID=1642928 RepID=UPI00261E7D47|nr:DUF2304 domain-containing protein [uncultured Pseudokineococcus sp.]